LLSGFQVLLGQHVKTFVELDMEWRTDMSSVPIFNQCHISVMYWSLPHIDAVLISWSPLVIWMSWLKDLLKEIGMTSKGCPMFLVDIGLGFKEHL
jgi:hypothetical protein